MALWQECIKESKANHHSNIVARKTYSSITPNHKCLADHKRAHN